jgi:hypothetical protein
MVMTPRASSEGDLALSTSMIFIADLPQRVELDRSEPTER